MEKNKRFFRAFLCYFRHIATLHFERKLMLIIMHFIHKKIV